MVMLEDCHGSMLVRNEDDDTCSEGSEATVKSVGRGRIAVIQHAGDESAGGMEVKDWICTRPAPTSALSRVCMQS